MIPPSRCWIVLRLDSDSTTPDAIAALSSGARLAHVPSPSMKQSTSRLPATVIPRSLPRGEVGVGVEHHGNSRGSKSSIAVTTTPDRRAGRGLAGARMSWSQTMGSLETAGSFQMVREFQIMAQSAK
ncbi:hypothetical protein [Bradyrhizobium japonicum]|uniref:hypothetical protein n=1 Tax=Bradyrhizobium japonicum TaxID=375 RepID=UPI003D9B9D84